MSLAAGLGSVAARPAAAQTAVNADAGIEGLYKPNRWLPVRVNLLNQGGSAKAEVRVRFTVPMDRGDEHRIPERTLPGSANEVHYVYLRSPVSYGGQNVAVNLYRDGRTFGPPTRPQIRMVSDGDWLVCGIGDGTFAATLKNLNGHTVNRVSTFGRAAWMYSGGRSQATVQVGVLEPAKVPDRWQGLQAADMVVLGAVSDREFTPDQVTALRDYVNSGGTLVVTGGVNSSRLTAPFFKEILPVTVSGTRSITGMSALARKVKARVPSGNIPVTVSTPKPGATVSLSEGDLPVVVSGAKGAGRVVFLAFDPAMSPFREWEGMRQVWSRILTQPVTGEMVPAISAYDGGGEDYQRMYGGGDTRGTLAQAPFAISQLDIPAFYIVAFFLLLYIVVLVPVNYFLLKKWDKKEYAWLTTPAIVLIFVVGAYLIGYGFKGGRTLLARVGVVEAHANQDTASAVTYAGLFSPAKTSYDIQLAAAQTGVSDEATTLLSEPDADKESTGLRVLYGDTPRLDDMAIDMWAMRVLKGEGLVRLGANGAAGDGSGNGFQVKMKRNPDGSYSGTVRNNTRFTLTECKMLYGGTVKALSTLAPGQSLEFNGSMSGSSGSFLPAPLTASVTGSAEEQRMKRAVLQPLCTPTYSVPNGWSAPDYPVMIGWVKESVAPMQINGGLPREQASTLMVVHLDANSRTQTGLE